MDGIAQSDVTLDADFASDFLFVNSMAEIIEFMHVYKGVKIYMALKPLVVRVELPALYIYICIRIWLLGVFSVFVTLTMLI